MARRKRKKMLKKIKKIVIVILLIGIILIGAFFVDKESFHKLTNNVLVELEKITKRIEQEINKFRKKQYDEINLDNDLMVFFLDQTTPNMIQRISGIFERNPLISKEI